MKWYHVVGGAVALTGLVICGSVIIGGSVLSLGGAAAPEMANQAMREDYDDVVGGEMAADEAPPPPPRPAPMRRGRAKEQAKTAAAAPEPAPAVDGIVDSEVTEEEEEDDAPGTAADDGDAVRQWFPESFLWAPLVETDASGTATVDMRVPDQLTTWRVLGLAHDRSGHQAGTLHTFDSRLPLYVDPVLPGWLVAGDRVLVPVQVVNTTRSPLDVLMEVEASGVLKGGGDTGLGLPGQSSAVRNLAVTAEGAGEGRVTARIRAGASRDAATRTVGVVPAGRPVPRSRGGTLSSTRSISLFGPPGADPSTQELTVRVFPGPLAVLQTELERLARTGGTGAYDYAVLGRVGELATAAGVEVDPRQTRRLRLVAWQRIVRSARAPDHGVAADLLGALAAIEGDELVDGLRPRLARVLVEGQRGDGTWARQPNAPLQQVLVQTAVGARALPEGQDGARLRASGAVERYAREVSDRYTAAVLLTTGLVDGAQREHLLTVVEDGLTPDADGATTTSVPAAVRNAWGLRPSRAEVIAWTALALPDDHEARGDLVAALMAGYDARLGFGAGPADAVALEAITQALPGLDAPVQVILSVGGVERVRAPLDPKQPRVPAVLTAAPRGGTDFALSVEPPVAGLAYTATLTSWVPWRGDESLAGVEVEVAATPMEVGADSTLTLSLSAPSGVSVELEQGLPAGTEVDEHALRLLAASLPEIAVHTDRVAVTTRPFRAGEILEIPLVVRPAFAGRFQTLPLTLRANGDEVQLAPHVWEVAHAGAGVATR